jgi:hypothetical protein
MERSGAIKTVRSAAWIFGGLALAEIGCANLALLDVRVVHCVAQSSGYVGSEPRNGWTEG